MENLLIEIYLFVCQVYDTSSRTCYQRLSNNWEPLFTDQGIITIWLFCPLRGLLREKRMHRLIEKYWLSCLPRPLRLGCVPLSITTHKPSSGSSSRNYPLSNSSATWLTRRWKSTLA